MAVVGGLIALGVLCLVWGAFRLGGRLPKTLYVVLENHPTELRVFKSRTDAHTYADPIKYAAVYPVKLNRVPVK